MSLLPSLRASSSRLTLPIKPAATLFPNARHFSASPLSPFLASSTRLKKASAEGADEELAKMRRQVAAMKRNGQATDFTSLVTPVIEPIVEPPFNPAWLFRKGIYSYIDKRVRRFLATRQAISGLVRHDAIRTRKGGSWAKNTLYMFTNRKPSNRLRPLLDELEKIYIDFNRAQAAGDAPTFRVIATADALSSAQTILRSLSSGRQMSWRLIRTNAPPKLMSVRVASIDHEGNAEAGQVVVRFDTDQELSITDKAGKSSTKRSRVVDHYVFERQLPPRGGWKIKQRLEVTEPPLGSNAGK